MEYDNGRDDSPVFTVACDDTGERIPVFAGSDGLTTRLTTPHLRALLHRREGDLTAKQREMETRAVGRLKKEQEDLVAQLTELKKEVALAAATWELLQSPWVEVLLDPERQPIAYVNDEGQQVRVANVHPDDGCEVRLRRGSEGKWEISLWKHNNRLTAAFTREAVEDLVYERRMQHVLSCAKRGNAYLLKEALRSLRGREHPPLREVPASFLTEVRAAFAGSAAEMEQQAVLARAKTAYEDLEKAFAAVPVYADKAPAPTEAPDV